VGAGVALAAVLDAAAEFQADGGVFWCAGIESFSDEDGEVRFDVAAARQGREGVGAEADLR